MKNTLLLVSSMLFCLYVKAQVSFPSGTYFPVGTQPLSICNADFNNDGKMDFATANSASNNISLRLGNGAGGFGAILTIPAGVGVNAVTNGDFNNDGKQDLVYINPNLYSISLRLGNGLGGFGAASTFGVAVGPNALVSDDFNNDGKMDVATCNSNTISVLLGNGLGSLGTAVSYTAGNQVLSIFSADFNNDGKKDLVTANLNSSNLSVFIGTGLGTFNAAVNYIVPSGPDGVTSEDFNNDNNPDLVCTNYDYSNVTILLGNGSGSFGSATVFATGYYPLAITHADYNGDGNMDIATGNPFVDSIYVLVGNGTGGFAPALAFYIAGGPYAIISTDFNNDGVKDIATANYLSNDVCVLLNNTGFTLTSSAGPNGSISPNGLTAVPIGGTQSYTITPSPCYHISNVEVDGALLGAISTYTFTTITSAHTIHATFAPNVLTGSSAETACNSYTWAQNGNTTYTVSGMYTQTFTTGAGCDSVHTLYLTIGCDAELNLKVFLQGYYISAGLMVAAMQNAGVGGSSTLTDSLLVELHDINTPFNTMASTTTIVNTDGTATCIFPSMSGPYYLSIKHKSSLITWSAMPVVLNSTMPVSYDFSNAANKAYGNNMKEMEPGVWALYSGDLNDDENIDLLDTPLLENDINNFASGYFITDLNGDGNVDLLDSPILEDNINNFIYAIHP